MGDFLLGPATPVPLRARRLHWLLPRWGGGMLRVAGDTRTVATLPSAGASDRSSRRRVVRKTSIQCFPHPFFGGKCAPTQRRMDSLPPPGHAGDGSSVCGSPGSPNRVAAWHARFPASASKGEERREGRILLRHGKSKRRRLVARQRAGHALTLGQIRPVSRRILRCHYRGRRSRSTHAPPRIPPSLAPALASRPTYNLSITSRRLLGPGVCRTDRPLTRARRVHRVLRLVGRQFYRASDSISRMRVGSIPASKANPNSSFCANRSAVTHPTWPVTAMCPARSVALKTICKACGLAPSKIASPPRSRSSCRSCERNLLQSLANTHDWSAAEYPPT